MHKCCRVLSGLGVEGVTLISIGLGGAGVVGRVVAVVVGRNGHCRSSSSQQAVLVVKISTAVRFGRV